MTLGWFRWGKLEVGVLFQKIRSPIVSVSVPIVIVGIWVPMGVDICSTHTIFDHHRSFTGDSIDSLSKGYFGTKFGAICSSAHGGYEEILLSLPSLVSRHPHTFDVSL